jgi:dihydrofolate reductase
MINAIFAVDRYGGMGYEGGLPWPKNVKDLAHFKNMTTDHVLVMGRKSWEDPKLPKPLKNRIVYVASHRPVGDAISFSGDICEKLIELEIAHPDRKIFVAGGPSLLMAAREVLDRVYLTYFNESYKVDTSINLKEFLQGFLPVQASAGPNFKATFVTYENIFRKSKTNTRDGSSQE